MRDPGLSEAMGSGEVDVNWGKEHYSLWYVKELSNGLSGAMVRPAE